jgi:hypothetical protein
LASLYIYNFLFLFQQFLKIEIHEIPTPRLSDFAWKIKMSSTLKIKCRAFGVVMVMMMMMMMEGRDASRNLPDNPRRMREFHGLAGTATAASDGGNRRSR